MKFTKLIFSAPTSSWSPIVVVELLMLSLIIILIQITNLTNQASAFHLSFGHRLLKAATNLNPASSLIRPIECRNSNNHSEAGICMFSIDCMHNKGVPLSVCKHNYFVGTCCRLPDYNNFVGIVYDLRDTETNQLMEARRISPEMSSSTLSSSVSSPMSLSSTLSATSYSPTQNYSTATQEFSTTDSLSLSRDDGRTSSSSPGVTSTTRLRDDFEADRYIISSTKLFSQSTAKPITTTTTTTAFSHEQERNKSDEVLKTSHQQQQNSGESARNADGGSLTLRGSQLLAAMMNYTLNSGNSKHNGQLVALPSELDSFQIHSELAQSNQTKTNQETSSTQLEQPKPVQNSHHNTYELIKDDSSDILVTVNSVHSPPTTQQHFNINELHSSPPETIDQRRPAQSTTQADNKQSTIYSFEDQSQQKNQEHQQQPVVFSNNHQQSSSNHPVEVSDSNRLSTSSTTKSAASSVITQSDQEFTISSLLPTATNAPAAAAAAASASVTTTIATSSPSPLSTVNSIEEHGDGNLFQSNSSNSLAGHLYDSPNSQESISKLVTVSPFVDLVSSNSAAQSTTPFTTSLSTASIPNISLHPHSSTTQTPNSPALVLSSQSSSPQTSTTKSNSPIQGSSQTTPQASSDGGDVSSLGFSQLYSNQHSGTSPQQQPNIQQVPSSSPSTLQPQNHNRPNFGILGLPQMASKIVTGSTSSNNLIPGLNGLQSAILSHIPFKIAGLSSGLSNYLQSATKPFGSRPLLSSNNAPALQYQQQMINQQNKSDSSVIKNTSQVIQLPGNVRFPGSSSNLALPSSTVASTIGIINSNNIEDQAIGGAVVSWQLAQSPSTSTTTTTTTTTTASTTTTAFPPISSHDVVKEAQLVCGRPQVNQINNQATGNEGKKRVARIVGGNQSLFGQWPWMVSLRQWRKGAFLHKCGAALLNENWAITAAHCVENVKVTDLLLRLGEFDVSNQAEPYPYIEKRVKSVVSHPSFDPKTFEYDLALLRFTEPIKYERNIVPVCVPTGNDSYVDRMATVIGWGRLYEDGPLPDIIQHVDVPIITNNECEKMYKNAGYIEEIPDMFICAGINKGGRDSCEGDSGGPLTMVDHDGRSYLVGIISWGIGCALPSQPGVYTRITAFSRWINQITAF